MNKRVYYSFVISIIIISVFTILFFCISNQTIEASADISEFQPTIVIDPGHGGEDGGASADNNVLEKNINLDISIKLKRFLQANGFDVVMTRESDTAIYDDQSSKKRSDLQNRVNIFNSSSDNIVISIHQNKFNQSKYYGTQIFYSTNDKHSKNLAESIKYSVTKLLQPDNERECKEFGSEIYILKNAQVPAVLVECGFLSNSAEANKLQDEEYQNQLSFAIYLGFMEYYNTNY